VYTPVRTEAAGADLSGTVIGGFFLDFFSAGVPGNRNALGSFGGIVRGKGGNGLEKEGMDFRRGASLEIQLLSQM
jgi:hypothetical protein